jgi:hypothetical protein
VRSIVISQSLPSAVVRDAWVGRVLDGRYRVVRCIGRGGMGAVYLAEHVRIRRKVAIKVLHAGGAASAGAVERFHREALAAAAVGNDHVVSVTDMGQLEGGAHYIVLEHLDGADLDWHVANAGPLLVDRCLRIALQLCEALAAVHAAGIIHRDLKPENLFLCARAGQKDFLKILDFGVCKMLDAHLGEAHLTDTGTTLGTPHYMAPEQVEGQRDLDQRADLYAVGGILYFMLTGQPPLEAPNLPRLFMRICDDRPQSLRDVRADVSEKLDETILRCLAKRPDNRFASADELRDALLACLSGHGVASSTLVLSPASAVGAAVQQTAHVVSAPAAARCEGYVPTRSGLSVEQVADAAKCVSMVVPRRRRWVSRCVASGTALGLLIAITALVAYRPENRPRATSAMTVVSRDQKTPTRTPSPAVNEAGLAVASPDVDGTSYPTTARATHKRRIPRPPVSEIARQIGAEGPQGALTPIAPGTAVVEQPTLTAPRAQAEDGAVTPHAPVEPASVHKSAPSTISLTVRDLLPVFGSPGSVP